MEYISHSTLKIHLNWPNNISPSPIMATATLELPDQVLTPITVRNEEHCNSAEPLTSQLARNEAVINNERMQPATRLATPVILNAETPPSNLNNRRQCQDEYLAENILDIATDRHFGLKYLIKDHDRAVWISAKHIFPNCNNAVNTANARKLEALLRAKEQTIIRSKAKRVVNATAVKMRRQNEVRETLQRRQRQVQERNARYERRTLNKNTHMTY